MRFGHSDPDQRLGEAIEELRAEKRAWDERHPHGDPWDELRRAPLIVAVGIPVVFVLGLFAALDWADREGVIVTRIRWADIAWNSVKIVYGPLLLLLVGVATYMTIRNRIARRGTRKNASF